MKQNVIKNDNYNLNIKYYQYPDVDEKNMLKFSKASYSVNNNILFLRNTNHNLEDIFISEPRYLKISDLSSFKIKIKQPIVDIKYNSTKLSFLSPLDIKEYYKPKPIYFSIAIFFHLFFISFFFITSYFINLKQNEVEIVEVTFGINSSSSQTIQKELDEKDGQKEATKTIKELPKLTKNVAPDTSEFDKPRVVNNPDALIFKQSDKTQSNLEHNKPIGPSPDKNKQKINVEDFLKRKEMDSRKVDIIKNDGVIEKSPNVQEGKILNKNKLPISPFSSPSNIPDSPFSQTPSGVLDGKISSKSYNNYKAYIGRQLKLNWRTSEGNNFPSNLKAKVEFTINQYGYLFGKPKIVKSSGNNEFDQLVLNSIESTFPVSDPPPKEIKPPKKFEANYTAKTVQ